MGDNFTIDLKTAHKAELAAAIRAIANVIESATNEVVGVTMTVKFYTDEGKKKAKK